MDDDAGSSASSSGRVPAPRELRRNEDWDRFLQSYHKTYTKSVQFTPFADPFSAQSRAQEGAQGQAQAQQLEQEADRRSPFGSRAHSHSRSREHSRVTSRRGSRTNSPRHQASREHSPGSGADDEGGVGHGSSGPRRRPAPRDRAFRDAQPNTSAAGPSNQDPEIPNLLPREFSRSDQDKAGREARRSARRKEKARDAGAGAGAAGSGGSSAATDIRTGLTDGPRSGTISTGRGGSMREEHHLTLANVAEHNDQEADQAAREREEDAMDARAEEDESPDVPTGEEGDESATGQEEIGMTGSGSGAGSSSKKRSQPRDGHVVTSTGERSGGGTTSRRPRQIVHYAELAPADEPMSSSSDEKGPKEVDPSSSAAARGRDAPPRRPPNRSRASADPVGRRSGSPEGSPPKTTRGSKAMSRERSQVPSYRGAASARPSLVDSATGTSGSTASAVQEEDAAHDRERIRVHYENHGYMPAPRQSGSNIRRRLRIIHRLGLDEPNAQQRAIFDRFTRLVTNVYKAQFSILSIVGREKQTFVSKVGLSIDEAPIDSAFCAHTIIGTGKQCMVVPNALEDWRFQNNPFTGTEGEHFNFYAGAPLKIGNGSRTVVIGSLCVMDHEAREFSQEDQNLLMDLAECVVSELELMHSQTAREESGQLHQISVDFLRRSLRNRPSQRPGESRKKHTSTNDSSSGKRHSGADQSQDEADIDIYDEACREIRLALDAHAVAVVDLSQFHLFYPAYQNTTVGGSSSKGAESARNTMSRAAPSTVHERSTLASDLGPGGLSAAKRNLKNSTLRGREAESSLVDRGGMVSSGDERGQTGPSEPPQSARRGAGSTNTGYTATGGSLDSSKLDSEDYSRSSGSRRAKATYAVTDPLMPGRTPQVLYIPSRRRSDPRKRKGSTTGLGQDPALADGGRDRTTTGESSATLRQSSEEPSSSPAPAAGNTTRSGPLPKPYNSDEGALDILGYSSEHDNFAFNFSTSAAGRKIVADFIASNVKTRRVWFARDDSEGIAMSINHLMPPGTETSLAMPVFDFDGQVAFAIVACWQDPLYTYPAGALHFVETIAGSLLAAVMKEKLHHAQRAQLNFAAAASHELRTPLHQINAAAQLLRSALHPALGDSPLLSTSSLLPAPGTAAAPGKEGTWSREDKNDILTQLEIIEANGLALGNILENIIDTLDIGRASAKFEQNLAKPNPRPSDSNFMSNFELPGSTVGRQTQSRTPAAGMPDSLDAQGAMKRSPVLDEKSGVRLTNFADVLEKVVDDAMLFETKTRRAAGEPDGIRNVEVILEVLPRRRGGWAMSDDPGPLARALSKIIHNAIKFTDQGYVHVTVQDISREVNLPTGYDNSMSLSVVSIDVKDTGRGMTSKFLDTEILQPFSKADPFMPGSGLGLGLAQRMIEIFGGKLAIASSIGKGTLVHVELPMHLLSEDNDDDMEIIMSGSDGKGDASGSGSGSADRVIARSDGIFLAGWDAEKDVGLRRVGKSLLRQFKLHGCRVVDDISLASLIVVPETAKPGKISQLSRGARKGVEVISLGHPPAGRESQAPTSPQVELRDLRIDTATEGPSDEDGTVRVTQLYLPLRPSIIRRIMRPALSKTHQMEYFRSAVVGGEEATREREVTAGLRSPGDLGGLQALPMTARSHTTTQTASSLGLASPVADTMDMPTPIVNEESINPSRPSSPNPESPTDATAASESDRQARSSEPALAPHSETQFQPLMRPSLEEQATDPLPQTGTTLAGNEPAGLSVSSATPVGSGQTRDGQPVRLKSPRRPRLKETISSPPAPGAKPLEDEPLRVLVVEDNAVNRRILTTMLRRTACHYAEAVDGQDAVNKFLSFAPDLILLDINMPIKDGYQAAAEIRQIENAQFKAAARAARRASLEVPQKIAEESSTEASAAESSLSPTSSTKKEAAVLPLGRGKRCKIIAVTAMSNEADKRRGLLESGIDEWRTKPVGINQLTEDVQRLKVRSTLKEGHKEGHDH